MNRNENKENVQNAENAPSNILKNTNGERKLSNNRRTENSTVGKDFCENFFVWLKRTENEIDADTFAKLRGELCELVGKYTLAKHN